MIYLRNPINLENTPISEEELVKYLNDSNPSDVSVLIIEIEDLEFKITTNKELIIVNEIEGGSYLLMNSKCHLSSDTSKVKFIKDESTKSN